MLLLSGKRWFPYMKGGRFRRWYGNQELVVNWFRSGAEILASPSFPSAKTEYFRRGVTWTELTSGKFSARLSPGGFIFDVKGSSAFPPDVSLVLGLLNSSFANYTLDLINPTLSYQVGDIARIPVPPKSSGSLQTLVDEAVSLAKIDSEENECTYDFVAPAQWPTGKITVIKRHEKLQALEAQIDEEVYGLNGISDVDRKAI